MSIVGGNPLLDDHELVELLEKVTIIETKSDFENWKQSFLKKYHNFLNSPHAKAAKAALTKFSNQIQGLIKLIKKIQKCIDDGTLRSGKVSVRARLCLNELMNLLVTCDDELLALLPGGGGSFSSYSSMGGSKSSKFGIYNNNDNDDNDQSIGEEIACSHYNNFHMGAVLIADGFSLYSSLSFCDVFLQFHSHTTLQEVDETSLIDEIDKFHDRFVGFCEIMSSLGLYDAMMRARKIEQQQQQQQQQQRILSDSASNTNINTTVSDPLVVAKRKMILKKSPNWKVSAPPAVDNGTRGLNKNTSVPLLPPSSKVDFASSRKLFSKYSDGKPSNNNFGRRINDGQQKRIDEEKEEQQKEEEEEEEERRRRQKEEEEEEERRQKEMEREKKIQEEAAARRLRLKEEEEERLRLEEQGKKEEEEERLRLEEQRNKDEEERLRIEEEAKRKAEQDKIMEAKRKKREQKKRQAAENERKRLEEKKRLEEEKKLKRERENASKKREAKKRLEETKRRLQEQRDLIKAQQEEALNAERLRKEANEREMRRKESRTDYTDSECRLDEVTRRKCYMWYARMGQPTRDEMKKKIIQLGGECNIKVEDVDKLPWTFMGQFLPVNDMNKMFVKFNS